MDHTIVGPDIERYLLEIAPPRDPVLAQMERVAAKLRFPIVGPLVGQLFFTLARAAAARSVFEMGSGFGYSTVWFARAVGPGGLVVHTEGTEKRSREARAYLQQAGLEDRVRFEVGDAREIIAHHAGPFDVIFCDIDKEQYPGVPDLALPRLKTGGLLIFDNLLWSGRVLDEPPPDEETAGVRRVTEILLTHPQLATTILPLRDGVSVSVKL